MLIGAGEINIRDFINREGEIGYIVNPEYWRMGYATEVSKLLIEFGFETLNLHRIFATCDPRNVGSYKVLEKNGMTKEGRIREDLLLKDGWRDSLLYSILEQEWISTSANVATATKRPAGMEILPRCAENNKPL